MTSNLSYMFDKDNMALGISNIGIMRKIAKYKNYLKMNLSDKKVEDGSFYTLLSEVYLNKTKSTASFLLKALKDGSSVLDRDLEAAKKKLDSTYEDIANNADKYKISVKSINEVKAAIKKILDIATNHKVDPQKTIQAGYELLNYHRTKNNRRDDYKDTMNNVYAVFEVWQKYKSWTYLLLNKDIRSIDDNVSLS